MQNTAHHNDEIIDIPKILEQIGGDKELLREVFRVFLDDSPDIRSRLTAALARKDILQLREVAHCAKSAVGNFCTEKAVAAAIELEEACKNGETAHLEKLTESLGSALIEVEEALRNALEIPF